MAKPKLHRHQHTDSAAHNEAPFEFDSKHGGGLLTLTEGDGRLVVDLFRLDDTVKVRVPAEHLWTQRQPKYEGTLLGAFEKAYVGALVRPTFDPECYTRAMGSDGDACVHDVRMNDGVLELLFIDPETWVHAANYVTVKPPIS